MSPFSGAGFVDRTSFRVYMSADQTGIVTSVSTKVAYNLEDWDVAGWFDAATNYRYMPLIKGTYLFRHSVSIAASVASASLEAQIWKNGTVVDRSPIRMHNTYNEQIAVVSLVQMNGTTDYVEFGVRQTTGSNQTIYGLNNKEYGFAEGARVF